MKILDLDETFGGSGRIKLIYTQKMIIKLYWQHSVEWNCLLINSGVLPLSWLPESNLEVVSVVLSFVSETIQITAVEATFGQPKLICLKGRFPRCNNLTRFAFETKLTKIRTKPSTAKICCPFSFVRPESDILGQIYVPPISHNLHLFNVCTPSKEN